MADVELAKYAEAYRPFMVVVGATGQSLWKQYFHYNVTMAAAKSLSTDLLVVRRGASLLPDVEVPAMPDCTFRTGAGGARQSV